MKSHVGLVLAALLIGAFHSAAQTPVVQPALPPDQLPPGAKFAGPEDPEYVAWSKTHSVTAPRPMENLGRGVIALNQGEGKVWVGWRLLGTEPDEISFNVYRSTDNGTPVKLNPAPIHNVTFFQDTGVDTTKENTWTVRPVFKKSFLWLFPSGVREGEPNRNFLNKLPANAPVRQYIEIPLQVSPGYTPNDCSVGDLDGDGEYEIIVHQAGRSIDTPSAGFSGIPVFEAYRMDGKFLWRIVLGPNIREGAHYTQFMVYDLDGDGKAEFVCKTAPGTLDSHGKAVILGNDDPKADYRAEDGHVETGPEYLTVFSGATGQELATVPYVPDRGDPRGWGGIGGNGGNDNGNNRRDRFTACVAYLDGIHPSVVMGRGYYGRTALAAWDFRDGKLTNRWVFDTGPALNGEKAYAGQGAHGISVGDVDHDGRDEIIFQSMIVDDNGKGYISTGFRHGDALHAGAFDPARPNDIEVFGIHENEGATTKYGSPGIAMYDGATGKPIWTAIPQVDVGRGLAADVDPRYPGYEAWGGNSGMRSLTGERIGNQPRSQNFVVQWDGDTMTEFLDGNHIDKWDWKTGTTERLLTAEGCSANNGSKSTPALSADLFGDWREEVMWRTTDGHALRIYSTTIPTEHRIFTLMHDPMYRLAIAWQNVAYNQPPHTGFYLGAETKFPVPRPNITVVQAK